jgi:hypothetical protein
MRGMRYHEETMENTFTLASPYGRFYILGLLAMELLFLIVVEITAYRALSWSYETSLARAVLYFAPPVGFLSIFMQIQQISRGKRIMAARLQGAYLGIMTATYLLMSSLARR